MNSPIEFCIQRRVTAHKTAEAWEATPHVSVLLDLDVTELLGALEKINREKAPEAPRITVNSAMLFFITRALRAAPHMNAHIQYDKATACGRITPHDAVHIALPMRLPDQRMFTPVLKHAEGCTITEITGKMQDLRRRADNTDIDCLLLEAGLEDTWTRLRKGQLWTVLRRLYTTFIGPDRLRRPTFSERRAHKNRPGAERILPGELLEATIIVSNVGASLPEIPVQLILLEIIAPQTAAIGLNPIRKAPRVIQNAQGEEILAIRSILPITACFDHRAMDFEHITGFFRMLTQDLSDPGRILFIDPKGDVP